MEAFIIELHEGNKRTYYNLYKPHGGPIIMEDDRDKAYVFQTEEAARNVLAADWRLKNAKVVRK